MLNSAGRLRAVRILGWCVLWTIVVLLLRIPPYIDSVFARDTVGRAYVPMGILGAVVAGLIATTLVMAPLTSRKHALLLVPALSLIMIGGAAGVWTLIPGEPFAGRLTVPPPINVYLAILFGAPLFGVTLVARRTRERIGLLILAIAGVALFERAWSSYSEIVWESQLLEVELSQLFWKIPAAAVLAGIAALMTARERLGAQPRLAIRAIAAVLPIVAAGLLLVPFRYPRIWTPRDIGTIQSARLFPTEDLVLQVSASDGEPVIAPALLIRRNGESVLRCPFRRPVALFSGWEPWLRPHGSIQGPRVALMVEASFWDFIRERPRSIVIGDPRTGAMETVCEERWAGWRLGRACQRAAIGPGLAWAVEARDENGSTVYGQLPSGSRFSVPIRNAVSLLWFSATQLQIVSIEPADRKSPSTGTPHCDRVDLATGKVTAATIPIGITKAEPRDLQLDPLGTGFVARVAGTNANAPGTLFFVNTNGNAIPLGPSPEWPLVLWRPGQSPLVLDMDRLALAFVPQPRNGFFVRELAAVSGHVYALAGPLEQRSDDLYEMDAALTHASPVARNVRDVQWLPDSILYVVAVGNGERVVRRWAATRKEEVLIAPR